MPYPPKPITVDFYSVELPTRENRPFLDILQHVRQLADDESRNASTLNGTIRLVSADEWRHGIEGEMIRIRMDQLPVKARLSGGIEDLGLEEDEGIGEETAFLYRPEVNVLLLQRNRSGVSAPAFVAYMEEKARIGGRMVLRPLLKADSARRLGQMAIVTKFEVKFAALQNLQLFRDKGHAVGTMANLSEELRAPTMSAVFSVGHERSSLNVNSVKNIARALFGIASSQNEEEVKNVKRIEISGKTRDGVPDFLDLLEERLQEIADVTINDDRRMTYDARKLTLRHAWFQHQQEIEQTQQAPVE